MFVRALYFGVFFTITTAAGAMSSASAMPVSVGQIGGPEIQLVAGGCGPGASRGTAGRCRPNGYFARQGRCFINRYGRRVCR